MQNISQLSGFGTVAAFVVTGIVLISLILFIAKLVAPRNPTPQKLATYECGSLPEGNAWVQFNPRFYVIALVFLLFDVELAFIFPVATVYADDALLQADGRWGWLSLGEIVIFVTILFLGLLYAWSKGDLEWIKPEKKQLRADVPIKPALYEKINAEVYVTKPFSSPEKTVVPTQPDRPSPPPAKPRFKPVFKKTDELGKAIE